VGGRMVWLLQISKFKGWQNEYFKLKKSECLTLNCVTQENYVTEEMCTMANCVVKGYTSLGRKVECI
jgi:hypothetical protein